MTSQAAELDYMGRPPINHINQSFSLCGSESFVYAPEKGYGGIGYDTLSGDLQLPPLPTVDWNPIQIGDGHLASDEDDSDDDEIDFETYWDTHPLSLREAYELPVTFGKHKGSTYGALMKRKKTRNYLRRLLLNWSGMSKYTRVPINMIVQHYAASKLIPVAMPAVKKTAKKAKRKAVKKTKKKR